MGWSYQRLLEKETGKRKTYNTRYSLVVTDPTTDPQVLSWFSTERTGCPVLSIYGRMWKWILSFAFLTEFHLLRTLRWNVLPGILENSTVRESTIANLVSQNSVMHTIFTYAFSSSAHDPSWCRASWCQWKFRNTESRDCRLVSEPFGYWWRLRNSPVFLPDWQ